MGTTHPYADPGHEGSLTILKQGNDRERVAQCPGLGVWGREVR